MAETERFIQCIQRKEAIWKFSSRDFRDVEKVNTQWQEVAMEMNSTKEVVKAKWGLLRTAYVRELEGVKNGTPSSWRYYQSLAFLEDNIFENLSWNEKFNTKIEDDAQLNDKKNPVLKDKTPGETVNEEEFNYLFLASLHPLMKRLPENKRTAVKIKILQFLQKY